MAAAAHQVKEKTAKLFTCLGCNMQFDSMSKKQTHKKKNKCKKKSQDPHFLLNLKDTVLALMPDMSVKELSGPPGFTFDRCFTQKNFCQLSQGRIFYRQNYSLGCSMLYPDVERLTFSVKSISAILTRPLNSSIGNDCMATDNKIVLLIGGVDSHGDQDSLSDTHIYSVRENSWIKGPNLNTARDTASACCLGGYTYTFFGTRRLHGRGLYLNSIERLNNDKRQAWQLLQTFGNYPALEVPFFAIAQSDD